MQSLITKGKWEFLGLIAVFCFSLLLMMLIAEDDEASGLVALYILFIPFYYLTWRRIVWAKWVLTAMLVFLAATFFLSSIGTEAVSLKISSLLLLFTAAGLHAFKGMRAYFGHREAGIAETWDEAIAEETIIEETSSHELPDEASYPSIRRRQLSVVADVMVVLIALVFIFNVLGKDVEIPFWMKMLLVCIVLSYEPVLTAFSVTGGQKLTSIRVRSFADPSKRIPLYRAYLRFVCKGLLGGISYFIIFSVPGKRALHDIAAGSIVLKGRSTPNVRK